MNYNDFFNFGIEKGLNNIQITATTVDSIEFEFINEKLENYVKNYTTRYSIKAEKNGKTEKLTSDYLGEEIIELLLLKIDNTDSAYEDEYLIKKELISVNNNCEVNEEKEFNLLKNIYKLKNKDKRISTITSAYEDSLIKTQIVNSNGANLESSSHNYYFYTNVLIEDNNEKISYDKNILKTNKKEIDFEKIVEETINEALIMATKEPLKTGKHNVILSANVSSRIISHLIEMLNQTNIRTKTSCLCDKLNKKIFNKKITIIEDPSNEIYPGFRLFDDEGTLTKKKIIIKDGILKTYLSNIKEAKMNKTISTGNSYDGISTRNMYLKSDDTDFNQMLKNIKDGIYITDFMGASNTSISAITGNISIQIFGFIIKNGKITSGFNPCIMTTTIFELLNNVKNIGNEIEFTNLSVASPHLLIENISIASEE